MIVASLSADFQLLTDVTLEAGLAGPTPPSSESLRAEGGAAWLGCIGWNTEKVPISKGISTLFGPLFLLIWGCRVGRDDALLTQTRQHPSVQDLHLRGLRAGNVGQGEATDEIQSHAQCSARATGERRLPPQPEATDNPR